MGYILICNNLEGIYNVVLLTCSADGTNYKYCLQNTALYSSILNHLMEDVLSFFLIKKPKIQYWINVAF